MQLKMFERAEFVSKSKGYQNVLRMLRVLGRMSKGGRWTAYQIAPLVKLSPQHVNRLLREAFEDGKVDFKTSARRGNPAREWWAK